MGKSFFEKLRNPDAVFSSHLHMLAMIVLLGFSFLAMIISLVSYAIAKLTGANFLISLISKPITILIIILLPYVTLKILQVYVYFKLKKNIQKNKTNICKEQQ